MSLAGSVDADVQYKYGGRLPSPQGRPKANDGEILHVDVCIPVVHTRKKKGKRKEELTGETRIFKGSSRAITKGA